MYSVVILGIPNCGKCEVVKLQLFPLRELGYSIEYRHATPLEIKDMKLTTAPVVIIYDHDNWMLDYFSDDMSYDNVLRWLEP